MNCCGAPDRGQRYACCEHRGNGPSAPANRRRDDGDRADPAAVRPTPADAGRSPPSSGRRAHMCSPVTTGGRFARARPVTTCRPSERNRGKLETFAIDLFGYQEPVKCSAELSNINWGSLVPDRVISYAHRGLVAWDVCLDRRGRPFGPFRHRDCGCVSRGRPNPRTRQLTAGSVRQRYVGVPCKGHQRGRSNKGKEGFGNPGFCYPPGGSARALWRGMPVPLGRSPDRAGRVSCAPRLYGQWGERY